MLIPGAPLVPILFLTQALNAVLLVPLLVFALRPPVLRADGRSRQFSPGHDPELADGDRVGRCVAALAAAVLV